MLSAVQRSALRRGRLVRAWAWLFGGLSTVPALILLIIAASTIALNPSSVFVLLVPPAVTALIALHRTLVERRLAPPLRSVRADSAKGSIHTLAPGWTESFERARAEQPLGAGTRRRSQLGLAGGMAVAMTAALVILLIAPIVSVVTGGAFIYRIASLNVGSVDEKNRLSEIVRPFALAKDPSITLDEAGRAFRDLHPSREVVGVFQMRPSQSPARRAWSENRPDSALFKTARPVDLWTGPAVAGVLDAAKRGFNQAEMAWLKNLATDPGWRDWYVVARAPRIDLLGARVQLPFPAGATAHEVPIPRFALIKEFAYASVSRAAYHLALNQVDSAETDLRETISAGFLIADNASFLIEQLIGVVVINIGRDGLARLYALTGRPEGARMKASRDSAVAALDARREIAELDSARGRASVASAPAARRAMWLLANQKSTTRALRMSALEVLSHAPCTNFRELVFGPDADLREALANLRGELALYPADSAVFELMRERTERGDPRGAWAEENRFFVGIASVAGFVLRNPRIRGCSEILLSF